MRKPKPPLVEVPVIVDTAKNGAHAERDHALCSASGAERWTVCTGSVALCELAPKGSSSKYAEEGTRAHELAEKLLSPLVTHWNLTQKDGWKESEMMDFTIYDNYPREMWEHCLSYVRLIWDMVVHYKPKKVFIEKRVYLSKEKDLFGTADCFFAFRDPKNQKRIILSIWDLKFGKGKVVDVADLQFKYYAAAVAAEFPKIKFDEFWLNVYQPRAEHEEGVHRQEIISAKDLEKTTKFLLKKADEALVQIGKPVKELTLTPCDDLRDGYCKWCDALALCPAFTDKVQDAAGMDFADDPDLLLPTEDDFQSKAQELIDFDKERFSKLLQIEPLVTKFFSTLKTTAINYLASDGDLPGWKLVETQGKRKWREDTGDIARGLKAHGVENPYAETLRNLGSIEEELYRKEKERNSKFTKNDAKKLIAPFVTKGEGGFTLAPENDPRPRALGHEKASNDFDAVSVEQQDLFD